MARQVPRSGFDTRSARTFPPPASSIWAASGSYRRAMREYKSRPEVGEDLSSILRIAIKDDYKRTKPKTNLDYPRKRAKRPPRKPRIRNATKWQVTRAEQVKESGITIGLTA